MSTIGVIGGTGFIGHHLRRFLTGKGVDVIIFTRQSSKKSRRQFLTYSYCDPAKGVCDATALQKLDAFVHLAGESISGERWTNERKEEILTSRIKTTDFMISQLKEHAPNCRTFVAASAIGYYGPDREGLTPYTEDTPPYDDFLANTCVQWEHESQKAASFMRTVILRFGLVLGEDGGAYPEMTKPFSYHIVPRFGTGKQMISWIEVDDLVKLIFFALERENISGIYNAVTPKPVSSRDLIRIAASRREGFKIRFRIPQFLLKMVAGDMSSEILKSCTVSGKRISDTGFTFQYPEIRDAIRAIDAADSR